MNIKKIFGLLLKILTLAIIVVLFLLFSWYGVIGYFVFVLLLATYILIKRRKHFILICKYGAKQLEKVFGNDKTKKNE